MTRASAHCTAAFALTIGLLAAAACSDSSDSGAGGAGAQPPVDHVDASLQLACTDAPASGENYYTADVQLTTLTSCLYNRGTKQLNVWLAGAPQASVNVSIVGFTGAGSYATVTDDTVGTSVSLEAQFTALSEGMADGKIKVGSWDAAAQRSFPCDIEASETNLADVEIPGDQGTTGYVTLQVTCPNPGGALIGKVDCSMTPESFEVTIGACQVFAH